MNAKGFRGVLCAALFGVLATGNANAEYGYFQLKGYEDEVHRCIDLLRPSLQAVDGDRVTYDIQQIDLRGPWYTFEISTTVVDINGLKKIDAFKVGCKANRWVDSAQLAERKNSQKLPARLELLARK